MAVVEVPANERPSLPSGPLESIAAEVARAASGMTNVVLARRAGLSPRTLRAILDPNTPRRFGRATLDKLDAPLSWPPGRAWTIYSAQLADSVGVDRKTVEDISHQMALMMQRWDREREQPGWAAQLVEACRPLSTRDREMVLEFALRLAHG